jgi:molecular chaperone GrpE (heat shock protein)
MQSLTYVLIGFTILCVVLLIVGWKVTPKTFLSRFLLIVVSAVGMIAVLYYVTSSVPSPGPLETENEQEAPADTEPEEEEEAQPTDVGEEQAVEEIEPEEETQPTEVDEEQVVEETEPEEETQPTEVGEEQVVEDTEPEEEAQPTEVDEEQAVEETEPEEEAQPTEVDEEQAVEETEPEEEAQPTDVGEEQAVEETEPEEEAQPAGDRLSPGVMSLLLAMAIVTALSLGTSYSLYRWRKRLTANAKMYIPEELMRHLTEMQQTNSELTHTASASRSEMNDSVTGLKKAFVTLRSETNDSMADLRQTLSTLAAGANQRDQEIRRLKDGYDISLLRKYFRQILSLEASLLSAREESPSSSEALDRIEQTLRAILDNYDIERFIPSVGSPVGEHGDKVADGYELVAMDSPEQSAGSIANVVESGFIALVGEDEWTVIRPAKVSVYGARTNTDQKSDGGE